MAGGKGHHVLRNVSLGDIEIGADIALVVDVSVADAIVVVRGDGWSAELVEVRAGPTDDEFAQELEEICG